MSKGKAPPVPPAGRSRKGGTAAKGRNRTGGIEAARHQDSRNLAEHGRQGNIRQNTRNQGYQQDR
jgi:hypothetical protein